MVQKFLPTSPNSSKMHYEIYRNKNATDEQFAAISEPYARVMAEDKLLCIGQQRNLDRGVFVSGLLHPVYEKAPLFFQSKVREAVREHWEREKRDGKEVWPARQKIINFSVEGERDEEICEGLGCGGRQEVVVW